MNFFFSLFLNIFFLVFFLPLFLYFFFGILTTSLPNFYLFLLPLSRDNGEFISACPGRVRDPRCPTNTATWRAQTRAIVSGRTQSDGMPLSAAGLRLPSSTSPFISVLIRSRHLAGNTALYFATHAHNRHYVGVQMNVAIHFSLVSYLKVKIKRYLLNKLILMIFCFGWL
jgi:hypothetical protein